MLQRIQTIFYLIALLAILIPLFGMDIFTFSNGEVKQHMTFFGTEVEVIKTGLGQPKIWTPSFLYIVNIVIALLLLITIVLYKSLKTQYTIGRFVLLIYGAYIIILAVLAYFDSQLLIIARSSMAIGAGFYSAVIGLPFIWLGNRGVRKDRKLLDSLNRLR